MRHLTAEVTNFAEMYKAMVSLHCGRRNNGMLFIFHFYIHQNSSELFLSHSTQTLVHKGWKISAWNTTATLIFSHLTMCIGHLYFMVTILWLFDSLNLNFSSDTLLNLTERTISFQLKNINIEMHLVQFMLVM